MISTHVLDVSIGRPATGMRVTVARIEDSGRPTIAADVTDADGRVRELVPDLALVRGGVFELTFETGAYFSARGVAHFHPRVTVTIEIDDPRQSHHVPLLVSPFGYTTYRGS
jgi:5-hydroxyisourate hydrolase